MFKEAATAENKGGKRLDIELVNEVGISNVRPGENNITNNLRDYKGSS